MTVEDAVELLNEQIYHGLFTSFLSDPWAEGFIRNIVGYVQRNQALSTEQSRLALKLIARARSYLVEAGSPAVEIDALLRRPSYRQTPYPSANIPREARYLGDNLVGFRFKRSDFALADLRAAKAKMFFDRDLWFHRGHRVWVMPVTRDTLGDVVEFIHRHRFDADAPLLAYLSEAADALGQPSSCATDPDLGVTAIWVPDNEVVAWFVSDVLGGERT